MKGKNVIGFHIIGNLIDDLLEKFILRNFDGIYHFLPVLPEILEKLHFFSFYSAFYAPFWVKNIVLSYESNFMQQFGKIRLPHFA